MQAERLYTLPESVDEDMTFDIGRQAENFEAHVTMLEKERACSTILGVFKRHPHLEALQFLVQDTDDVVTLSNGRRLQALDVTPIFDETFRDEDTWDETSVITRDLAGTLTARNGDFFECLTLQRSQVLSADDESRFPNLRAMRSWIEIDLK